MDATWLTSFKAIFLGIFLEALPYILIGVILSSLIHVFLPEKWIQKHMPKTPVKGMLFAIAFGFIFPICECGIIPVIKRLVQKGMPAYMGVVLLIVGPIFNPVVMLATYTAFQAHTEIFYMRMIFAILIGLRVGLSFTLTSEKAILKANAPRFIVLRPFSPKWVQVMSHAVDEFFDMGFYLLLGAGLTALLQVGIPHDWFKAIGQSIFAHPIMMLFAYVLSLCSTSDAFVGYSLWNTINHKAIVTFLVFGPMLDIKSTLMLYGAFQKSFVRKYIGLVIVFVLIMAVLLEIGWHIREGLLQWM
jgi:uncharacterized membrane protein YraQ (UPF0718 family)